MASEPVECQVLVLRVSIHCEGCKKKVKKVLLNVDGVYRCDIDGRSNRVTVTASRKLDASILVARLRKSGKQAEPWPEEPKQQQQPPAAESQSQETKNQTDDPSKPNEPAENAEAGAAAPSNGQPPPEPKKSADETPTPAQESREVVDANGSTGEETKPAAAGHHQPSEAKGKAKQQQQDHHQEKPIDAKVTVEFDRGSGSYASHHRHMPVTAQQPAHVVSYNVARPMASTAYYATPPTPAPMPMPMPMPSSGPSQGYIDEYAPSNYDSRPASSPYEPYYYPPQPSPYRHQHFAADDYYYYGAPPPPPPQRSAFSPPRDAYGDMFNDENSNSCSVM